MSYKLISVKKIKSDPDILEIEYKEKVMFGWSHIKKDMTHKDNYWRFVSTGDYVHRIDSAIDKINQHLEIGETFTL